MANIKQLLDELDSADAKFKQSTEELGEAIRANNLNTSEPTVTFSDLSRLADSLGNAYKILSDRINNVREELYNHYDGHLPKIPSSSQMKTALKSMGLSDEYEVQKKVIFANKGTNHIAEISIN